MINRVLTGLTILEKVFGKSADVRADHDIIWSCDGAQEMLKNMSTEDKATLTQCGWHIDEDLDCWAINV